MHHSFNFPHHFTAPHSLTMSLSNSPDPYAAKSTSSSPTHLVCLLIPMPIPRTPNAPYFDKCGVRAFLTLILQHGSCPGIHCIQHHISQRDVNIVEGLCYVWLPDQNRLAMGTSPDFCQHCDTSLLGRCSKLWRDTATCLSTWPIAARQTACQVSTSCRLWLLDL
jgi:hypothetical protein